MSDQTPNSGSEKPPASPRGLLYGIGAIVIIGLGVSLYSVKNAADTGQPTTAAVENTPAPSESQAATASTGAPDLTVDESGLSKAIVTIETEKGKIKFRFYTKDAPNTVARIVQLIQTKFYDGLVFHRVVPDFVIQGGDPNGNGTGGSGQKLKAEFNSRKHVAGTVAMARAQDPDSADSQFYIALGSIPHLDGGYTVFGQVAEGLDVVKKIAVGDRMTKVTIE